MHERPVDQTEPCRCEEFNVSPMDSLEGHKLSFDDQPMQLKNTTIACHAGHNLCHYSLTTLTRKTIACIQFFYGQPNLLEIASLQSLRNLFLDDNIIGIYYVFITEHQTTIVW
jgi:hypothetical protein